MSLIEQLQSDMKLAQKSKDVLRLSTIRMIISSVSYAKIEKGRPLTDDEVLEVLSKAAKQRKETIEAALKGGRDEMAAREKEELEVIEAYLPEQLSPEEVEKIIRDTASEIGVTDIKMRGKLTGAVMQKLKARADGKLVNMLVEKVLLG